MKRVRIIEDPNTYTITIIKDQIETPEFLSKEQIAKLETEGDIMVANALKKYEKDSFWKIIMEE